jgi:predicted acetyltransferase
LNEEGRNDIAEFFVINKYRNIGAGTFMANKIFELYKGEWEIRTLLKNLKAQSFWRNVVDKESDGNFKEGLTTDNSRYAFYFKN